MNIVVCIKQVPDVDDIKWTKENNLDRQGMLSKLNSADEWALNWAMNLKSKFKEASVTAISMGPNQALDVLEYALAKGAERAILLSDKSFSGSDTLITAKILTHLPALTSGKRISTRALYSSGNVLNAGCKNCDGLRIP